MESIRISFTDVPMPMWNTLQIGDRVHVGSCLPVMGKLEGERRYHIQHNDRPRQNTQFGPTAHLYDYEGMGTVTEKWETGALVQLDKS